MTRAAEFPWVIVPAYAVLMAARRINRWLDQPPRQDQGRLTGTIVRRGPGRELERRGGS